MKIEIDPDVKAVAEFMQSKIEARKLVGVAESLRAIAPIIWGHHDQSRVVAIKLCGSPITRASRLDASELPPAPACARDGSAAEVANYR